MPNLPAKGRVVGALVDALASVRTRGIDNEVGDGLKLVQHLLDAETLLRLRMLLQARFPDDCRSLQIIDRALMARGAQTRCRDHAVGTLRYRIEV